MVHTEQCFLQPKPGNKENDSGLNGTLFSGATDQISDSRTDKAFKPYSLHLTAVLPAAVIAEICGRRVKMEAQFSERLPWNIGSVVMFGNKYTPVTVILRMSRAQCKAVLLCHAMRHAPAADAL